VKEISFEIPQDNQYLNQHNHDEPTRKIKEKTQKDKTKEREAKAVKIKSQQSEKQRTKQVTNKVIPKEKLEIVLINYFVQLNLVPEELILIQKQ
jgi:hypothetical protein